MTPQSTPLNLYLHFDDGTTGNYPVIGWVKALHETRYVYAPVVVVWDNRAAVTIYPNTTEVTFGGTEKTITTAYFGSPR